MTLPRLENDTKVDELRLRRSADRAYEALSEELFQKMMAIERKRTERSGEPFLLMLLEAANEGGIVTSGILEYVLTILSTSFRDTDLVGWYKNQSSVGVLFTSLGKKEKNTIVNVIYGKVSSLLRGHLSEEQLKQISTSFHFFPDTWDPDQQGCPSDPALYPDLFHENKRSKPQLLIKQSLDIAGSSLLLVLLSPLLVTIAIAVKLSSKGPMLFRQQRVGQYGRRFTFLKFRSMYCDNDDNIHKEYTTKLIAGEIDLAQPNMNGKVIYKMTNDSRITPIGRLLRRTSLDELPQLINVLRGDMSLVGPRPALPYEVDAYQTWHRRRVLEVKPGITGLWQVTGRSKVRFDDMVRLDLQYATTWSPWLDFKILVSTPRAVVEGAY